MPGSGWKDCCCTMFNYDWCDLCYSGITESWLYTHFFEEWKEGTWACVSTAACVSGTGMQATGSGKLINRIPITTQHSARATALRALAIGESLSVFLGWQDANNYIEVRFSRSGTTTGTSQIIKVSGGVSTVVEECELDCYSASEAAYVYGCVQNDIVVARTPCCTLIGNAISVGNYVGFGHVISSPLLYSQFIAYEMDTPEWEARYPNTKYCESCRKCHHNDILLPYSLTATVTASTTCAALIGYTQTLRWIRPCNPGVNCKDVGGDEGLDCTYRSECPLDVICPGDATNWFPYLELDATIDPAGMDINTVLSTATSCDYGLPQGTVELLDHSESPLWWLFRWHILNGYNGLTNCCDNPTCVDCYIDILVTV